MRPQVVRLLQQGDSAVPGDPAVLADLAAGDPAGRVAALAGLNRGDAVLVQHEYGIYGGADGDEAIALVRDLQVPVVLVLHTVLQAPSPRQRGILEELCSRSDAVIVMTAAARSVLLTRYAVPAHRVTVIPHGAGAAAERSAARGSHRLLTWGLLGPGKGIEWGIRAIAELGSLAPPVTYRVLGQTHPKVLAAEGDRYREMLLSLAAEAGVADRMSIEARYLAPAELDGELAATEAVLLPYDSHEQVTSGVLVEATAAQVPVVATDFPHARELLGDGAGIVVPHRDPAAIAAGLLQIFATPSLAAERVPTMPWSAVAQRYAALLAGVVATVAA